MILENCNLNNQEISDGGRGNVSEEEDASLFPPTNIFASLDPPSSRINYDLFFLVNK